MPANSAMPVPSHDHLVFILVLTYINNRYVRVEK